MVVTLKRRSAESILLSLALETWNGRPGYTESRRKCWGKKIWKKRKCSQRNQDPNNKTGWMGQKHEKEAEGLRVSEECSGGAERAPELVIKEKCRRRAGMWGRKSDQWFIFLPAWRTDLPEPAEPQSSGLLLWDGFHPGPGLNLILRTNNCGSSWWCGGVGAAEILKDSSTFDNLRLHSCTCCRCYASIPNTPHTYGVNSA